MPSPRWIACCLTVLAGAGAAGQESPGPDQPVVAPAPPPADPRPLAIGDPAPPIEVAEWVRGEPVEKFESGRVYVVAFWSTWCQFCPQMIPVLSRVQGRYRDDLTVIAVSVWERRTSELNTPEHVFAQRVRDYAADHAREINYRVAFGGVEGGMARSWMGAARRYGIPAAFIIDRRGEVAWVVNPIRPEHGFEFEEVLGRVVRGEWDARASLAELRRRQDVEKRGNALIKQYQIALQEHRVRESFRLIDEMTALDPQRFGRIAIEKFRGLLVQLHEYDTAYQYAAAMHGTPLFDQPLLLNDMAHAIAAEPGLERRDLDLALRLALRACELTAEQNGLALDTLARVHAARGRPDLAAQAQEKAVARVSPDTPADVRAAMAARLVQYRQAAGVQPR